MARIILISVLCALLNQVNITGQPRETGPGTYIIFLKDKKNNKYNIAKPETFLSRKSIERRTKQHISPDSADLPVSAFYTDSLRKLGVNIHNVSRWMNSVTFKTSDPALLTTLGKQNFVQAIKKQNPLSGELHNIQAITSQTGYDSVSYGFAYKQIHLHNGDYLHKSGFRGENILIAVIDAGFSNYRTLNSFQNILKEDRIKGVRDFVAHDGEVNSDHTHGMHVLSIIGGEIENTFIGTAPKADFLLLRSEDATVDAFGIQNEFLVEEDNWIAAAEYADSLGADVINTSLGYTTFNNPAQNHTYQDMDGSATRISRAAETASRKGMIVVVSAGNEGASGWKYISAPADAKNILTVGAVNANSIRAPFSSVGPTADGRIKPDVMALGQGTYVQSTSNVIGSGNGTSFSAPVITGLVACLWQAAPNKTNVEIMDAIRKCSDRYENPDNNYGYGIPDFKKAMLLLNPNIEKKKISGFIRTLLLKKSH